MGKQLDHGITLLGVRVVFGKVFGKVVTEFRNVARALHFSAF